LTAESFVPNPDPTAPGERMYRTGDLARRRTDGSLEFLGRVDRQVKVHGFRFEVSEVEAAIRRHEAVADCLVLVREGSKGSTQLVAYVVPRRLGSGQTLLGEAVREYVGTILPNYMCPSAYVLIERFPRLPNGKIDARSLPAPHVDLHGFVSPRNSTEAKLASIWAQALGHARVSVRDNFFSLGGDSILSVQVAARARDAGIHMTTRQLFQFQTIQQLAAAITSAVPRHQRARPAGAFPLTPIQRWFFELPLVNRDYWCQCIAVTLA